MQVLDLKLQNDMSQLEHNVINESKNHSSLHIFANETLAYLSPLHRRP